MDVLNVCLNYLLNESSNGEFRLDDVYPKDDCELYLRKLKNYENLFTVENEKIKVNIKATVCKNKKNCKLDCNLLHICEHEMNRKGGCCRRSCKFIHALDTPHNMSVLNISSHDNVDFKLVKKLFQKYSSDENSQLPPPPPSQWNSITETSSIIEITLPKEFCERHDKEVLFLIFSNSKRIGGDVIVEEDSVYAPETMKAFICYRNPDVAQRLAYRGLIEYQDFKFIIKLSSKEAAVNVLKQPEAEVKHEACSKNNGDTETPEHSNALKITDLTNSNSLTLEKIMLRLAFAKDHIKAIEIQQNANTAIVKFDTSEYAESISHLVFKDIQIDLAKTTNTSTASAETRNSARKQPQQQQKATFQKPEDFVKSLRNNVFLGMIVDSKEWRTKLFEVLNSHYANVEYNQDNLIIKCTLNSSVRNYESLAQAWHRKINSIITSYLRDFSIDESSISIDEYDAGSIRCAVQQFNRDRGLCAAFKIMRSKRKVYIVTKRNFLTEFLNFMQDFTQKKSKAMDYLIPKIDADYYELLKMLVEKMSRKYTEMELISYEGETQKVKLRGPGDRVDQIQLSLVNCISKLRSQKLTAIREECLKCSNLLRMLEAIATKRQLLFCKFKRFANGIYVTYFHECTVVDDAPTLRDIEDFDSYLSIYYTVTKIDFINHMHVLNTLKWTEFKANNLSNNQEITFDFIESKQFIIFGSKESVFAVECKIQQILSESSSITKPMDLQQEDTLFLRYSACDVLTQLEKLHLNQKIKFEFNEMKETGKNNELDDVKRFELTLNNCNNSIYTDISSILKSECLRKAVKQIEVSGLPGLVKLLHKNNSGFRHALDQIRNDMKCSISYETVLYDYHCKPPTTENADDNQRRFIGNSCLTIQKGNIVHAKADVIVNSCASSLKLNSGTLSRYILEATGPKVQQECLVSHPNGITSDEIAITSAGEMKNCRKLYHVTCPSYNQNNKILEKVIMNCLNQLKKDKLKSIAIPAIGSGNLNYPADLVACALVETCSKFLQVNKDEKYELNIIIYEKDHQVYKAVETFFKAPVLASPRETRVKRAQATFTIICNNDATLLKVISTKLTDLIRSYIYKDKIDSDTAKNLKDEKLNGILQILPDIEITRDKSGVFHLHGYKDDIAVYKEKIRDLMITHVEDTNQLYQSFIKTSSRAIKDVQWEYNDNSDDKWTPFNLFINSTIEDAFTKKQSMASFLNEDGNEAIVYFDSECYVIDDKNYSIRRVDCPNAQYKFPDNWVFQNSAADYELVTVDKRSTEFMLVMSEFLAKMQGFAAVIQIDRIQNKRLYQGYLLHRDYIKKKNNNCENEKILYHGTDEKNIVNIYKTGFNRSYCGVHGVAFGHGVYFALNSSYSNGYVRSSSGCKKMFRCRVLVGACTLGSSSMKVAPSKPNGDPYDSTGVQCLCAITIINVILNI